MNNVELARTLSWRENALFEEREKNRFKPHITMQTTIQVTVPHLIKVQYKFRIVFLFIAALPDCKMINGGVLDA